MLPLKPGQEGSEVADVQQRLVAVGFSLGDDEVGWLGPCTHAAIREFQRQRGLRVDGVLGRHTWAALVEAGHQLGNRYLYRRTPMLRGDDIAELQTRLGTLGFDCGKVDGIFGDQTAKALTEFQRNTGLNPDGICGPETLGELQRLTRRAERSPRQSVAPDLQSMRRSPRPLTGRKVVLGEPGGLGATIAAIARRLSDHGAAVVQLHHPDDSQLALLANATHADVFIGLRVQPDQEICEISYYAGYRYESSSGKRLAQLVQDALGPLFGPQPAAIQGMSIALLRETRMPAVLCELGPALTVARLGPSLALALHTALQSWVSSDWS